MSKGKSDKKPEAAAAVTPAPAPPEAKPEAKAAPTDAKAPPAADAKADTKEDKGKKQRPEPLLTFSRYFAHTGKPDHHQLGMAAWLKKRGWASGRQTLAKWEKLFASY